MIDLILEGSIEVSKSKKVPKLIRYILILLVVLFFVGVIGLILYIGICTLEENILYGIIVILFGLFLLTLSIFRFRKIYLDKKITKKENSLF